MERSFSQPKKYITSNFKPDLLRKTFLSLFDIWISRKLREIKLRSGKGIFRSARPKLSSVYFLARVQLLLRRSLETRLKQEGHQMQLKPCKPLQPNLPCLIKERSIFQATSNIFQYCLQTGVGWGWS